MPHEFELRKQITLKTTPEQVWEAIATGPGIDSWFMGRNEIEPREGGATRQDFGDFSASATVTAWEPAKRFGFRSDVNPDGTFMAFEFLIEGRDQAGTVLRLVQSGVLGDDWEAEYDALQRGWDMYLHTLNEYLTHFPGRTATTVVFAARPGAGGVEPAWTSLQHGLGLTAPVAQGDRTRLTPEGFDPIEGVADYVAPGFLGVRSDDGLYRFIEAMDGTLVLGHHLFADPEPKQTEQAWQDWLGKLPA